MCEPGQDNLCGHRFDRQYGELPLGYDHKYVYSHFGYNLKATDMQAAVGCAQLKKFPSFVEKRKHNFKVLHDALECVSDKLMLPEANENSDPSWFGFFITCRDGVDRNKLVQYVESKGVQTRMLFAGNLIKHPCFDEMRASGKGYRVVGTLENTDRIMNDSFWIGVYPGMTDEKLMYMAKTVIEALKRLKTKCDITIYTDSKYVADGLSKGWAKSWKAKGWKKSDNKPALNPDLWEDLLRLCDIHKVTVVWVKGHASHPENERCDRLAVAEWKKLQ